MCTKVTVTKGSRIGRGVVVGAHAVVKGDLPDYAVAAGIPAKVVRDRRTAYEADAERRAAVADMSRKAAAALKKTLETHN
jgi:serine acetyltransferase